jgi:hypothetical protein
VSARITIELLPSGITGLVHVRVATEVSGDQPLTTAETMLTLEQTLEGLRTGDIASLHKATGSDWPGVADSPG